MSVTTNQPRGLNLPRPKPPIVPVTQENIRDWWGLLANRKAYASQSANPHPRVRMRSPAHGGRNWTRLSLWPRLASNLSVSFPQDSTMRA